MRAQLNVFECHSSRGNGCQRTQSKLLVFKLQCGNGDVFWGISPRESASETSWGELGSETRKLQIIRTGVANSSPLPAPKDAERAPVDKIRSLLVEWTQIRSEIREIRIEFSRVGVRGCELRASLR